MLSLVVGGAVATVIAVRVGAAPYRAAGNADPGALVRIGTPLLRAVTDLCAVMCTGALAYGVLLTSPQTVAGRELSVSTDGYRALLTAGRWGLAWCGGALAMASFSAASGAGLPLADIATPVNWLSLVDAQEEPRAWLITTALAAALVFGCRRTVTWRPMLGLLALAVLALLPPLATGHSSSDAGHDLATAAIMIHVPAAAVWLGALVMLLTRMVRGGRGTADVARRYAGLATGCWLIVVGSGVVDAVVLIPGGDLLTSNYGRTVTVSVVVAIALGGIGLAARRRAVRAIGTPHRRWPMVRLLGAEMLLLMVAVGTSAELTQLAPPAFSGGVTMSQTLLGYDLAGPPTVVRLLVDWRPEVLFGTAAIGLAGWYLVAVFRLRRRGQRWPARRTGCWLAGCLVVLLATSSGIGRYEPAMFSVHMAAHMLLAFVAPWLLALGAPITLVKDSSRPAPDGLPAGRDWLGAIVSSWPATLLTHPFVALILLVGSPFVLYFTPAFDVAARFHWAHMALDGYFLVVGYLFAWPVIGTDPAPRPLPNLVRVGMVLAAAPFTAAFAAVVISTRVVLGNGPAGSNMYSALALPWVPDLLADQRLAGLLALAIGEASLFAALVVLLARWAVVDDDPDASGMIRIGDLRGRPVESPQPQAVGDDQQ